MIHSDSSRNYFVYFIFKENFRRSNNEFNFIYWIVIDLFLNKIYFNE